MNEVKSTMRVILNPEKYKLKKGERSPIGFPGTRDRMVHGRVYTVKKVAYWWRRLGDKDILLETKKGKKTVSSPSKKNKKGQSENSNTEES